MPMGPEISEVLRPTSDPVFGYTDGVQSRQKPEGNGLGNAYLAQNPDCSRDEGEHPEEQPKQPPPWGFYLGRAAHFHLCHRGRSDALELRFGQAAALGVVQQGSVVTCGSGELG